MAIFNARDIKCINKNSPPIKVEDGYTHIHMIAVPKEGYKCPEVNKRDEEVAFRLRSMGIKASYITKNISDIMFQHDINHQEVCMMISNECGRIRNLSNALYKIAAEIGDK